MPNRYPLLGKIDNPEDLKKLKEEDLVPVCSELRDFIIDSVSCNPGHFGASLGVVELTVALHYVFNTPYDRLVWDVGHQAYAHKILTGRKSVFHTNRKYKGISGFPNRKESPFDSFGVGHSSTSISAALGMAIAAQKKGEQRQVIAVIGDGSLTGGMAFEGLNNAGANNANILVILNDNNMAIDPNVGALKEYLLDITTSKTYNKFKTDVWNALGKFENLGPKARRLVQKLEGSVKSALLHRSNLFESLNLRYFGPVDGHDVEYLVKILNDLKDIPGPKLLHCITTKGKGYKPAEENQTAFHAPGLFDRETGKQIVVKHEKPLPPKYQDVFGETLLELAIMNPKIYGITPAMPSGCSMNILMDKLPERAFDVGIAEQHAVTFAAGMAAEGDIPFCNIYSSFSQRAYDQIIHDVALQNLPVVMCLDRAGIVGEDGATHHGVFDMAFLRPIPNITIVSPLNEVELRNMMFTAQLDNQGPWVIRYPRGRGELTDWKKPFRALAKGKGQLVREGRDLAILCIGPIGNEAIKAANELSLIDIEVAIYDMRFLKPLDEELLEEVRLRFQKIITLEDGALAGGFGSAVLEYFCSKANMPQVVRLGIPDKFIEHGSPTELYRECGIDKEGIKATAFKLVNENIRVK
ncbi:1-deoxy-D-xylulose-5-phosphate synthase [Williamwhitmania taraxaci]|uniref:1-deoxy-D-xylulose-5-phosphate synthase n=1 Tax=Williamwhitmania taraxaci TaxID=1640674 RepID=A0A1G6QHL8_9BACT|nr:1-deoxy-D-xylulose-5-phosphate synthase [Williamwhitmania taraxaci]SDC91813.1 1-deoxy-D-xylulose-5-phosphate synthase [Williamwhitmania taraxaci]